jgi:hypothetical protein
MQFENQLLVLVVELLLQLLDLELRSNQYGYLCISRAIACKNISIACPIIFSY